MKAALSQYEVDIQMSQDTLQALKQGGYTLMASRPSRPRSTAPRPWYGSRRTNC